MSCNSGVDEQFWDGLRDFFHRVHDFSVGCVMEWKLAYFSKGVYTCDSDSRIRHNSISILDESEQNANAICFLSFALGGFSSVLEKQLKVKFQN